ncbi:MAG: ZnF protein [Campylobacterota bacterium]|nr:ZnF protein [Campylobacterota bacterium]
MNENSIRILGVSFPNKVKRSQIGFFAVMRILDIKASFPRVSADDCVALYSFFESKKERDILNLVRLSSVESLGFKVGKNVSEAGIRIKEYSIFDKAYKDEVIFDISDTTLPRHLSRGYAIEKFKLDRNFLNLIKENYKKSTGLSLVEWNEVESAPDFYNKTVFYSGKFRDENDKKDIYREFGTMLRAIVIAETVKNQDRFNQILGDPELRKLLRLQVVLVTNAIFNTMGLGVKKSTIAPEYQKGYVWGKSIEDVFNSVNALSSVVAKIIHTTDLEASFQKSYIAQREAITSAYINSPKSVNYGERDQAIYDERGRIASIIRDSITIEDIARDFGGAEILKHNAPIRCISPDHEDTNPSMSLNHSKQTCKCHGCGFQGDIFYTVMQLRNVSWKESVDLIAETYGIHTGYDTINSFFDNNASKEKLIDSILNKYRGKINKEEFEFISNLDLQSLKEYEYKKKDEDEKNIVYDVKERKVFSESATILDSFVLNSVPATENSAAMKYLRETRGFKNIPPELRVFNGRHTNDEGKVSTHSLVGFINQKNGSDGKYYAGGIVGRARSFGEKAITVLNPHNLKKPNPNFIIAESQWDLVAFYNDTKGRAVYDNSVSVILNGTAQSDMAQQFINEHKGYYSGLIILTQADGPNQKAMSSLVFGTEITKHAHVWYTDEEVEMKKDINDLLRDGVEISSRFNTPIDEYMTDVVARKNNNVLL